MDNIMGGIWATTPVDEVPEIVLRQWRVMELKDGDRHFVGYNVTEGEGRVSSKIVTYDPVTKRGVTQSGRVYQLDGSPGYNGDAIYVWNKWQAINEVFAGDFKDVSHMV